jgi:hypothetical protein
MDPVAPHVPAYRFVLTNHSTRALMVIQYRLYRGHDLVITGRRKTDQNEPLARPGQDHVFELPTSRGSSDEWRIIDRAEITSVMWDDGLVEGDPVPAQQERGIREGRARSIRDMLALLRSANKLSIADFRTQFARLRLYDPIRTRIPRCRWPVWTTSYEGAIARLGAVG